MWKGRWGGRPPGGHVGVPVPSMDLSRPGARLWATLWTGLCKPITDVKLEGKPPDRPSRRNTTSRKEALGRGVWGPGQPPAYIPAPQTPLLVASVSANVRKDAFFPFLLIGSLWPPSGIWFIPRGRDLHADPSHMRGAAAF